VALNPPLAARISDAIRLAEDAHRTPGASGYLPPIIASLKKMLEGRVTSREARRRVSGALWRLVTDDYAFSESPLGMLLLQIADEFCEA
jgi:hypothetical protein